MTGGPSRYAQEFCAASARRKFKIYNAGLASPCASPLIADHQISPEDFEERGDLASCAAKIVMKVLYGARFLRYDLLWPVASVAQQISKWNNASDRRLHQVVSTCDGWLGRRFAEIRFCDQHPRRSAEISFSAISLAGDSQKTDSLRIGPEAARRKSDFCTSPQRLIAENLVSANRPSHAHSPVTNSD